MSSRHLHVSIINSLLLEIFNCSLQNGILLQRLYNGICYNVSPTASITTCLQQHLLTTSLKRHLLQRLYNDICYNSILLQRLYSDICYNVFTTVSCYNVSTTASESVPSPSFYSNTIIFMTYFAYAYQVSKFQFIYGKL